MGAQRWRGLPSGNLSDCPNGSRWVMEVFNECAQDGRDIASVVLGLVSIFCFAAASFPQFYQACKTGIMDRALSIYFLLGWLGGDLLNLIGSFLADQLPLQVYTAVYYVLADLVMLSLYGYYKVKNRGRGFAAPINAAFVFLSLGTVWTVSLLGRGAAVAQEPAAFKGRSLLSAGGDELGPKPFSKSEIIGFTIGSVSSVLYLCSRLPQIYTNVSVGAGGRQPGPGDPPGVLRFRIEEGWWDRLPPLCSKVPDPRLVSFHKGLFFSVFPLQSLIHFSPLPLTYQRFEGGGLSFCLYLQAKGELKGSSH
ncbi:lysosomal amino acid transporter 1 homolog isoform X1 [Rissa tridactyla]|uniref:lysosomal amino acid transporter 1 homolog isoform X1 n=1 Tax=Rissa tridactyla TaxID=75485 RepID=UPI0023BAD003|nr:lysosomal amino acid transporter 1 homolog isoform X1 [Rissa tridactyla]